MYNKLGDNTKALSDYNKAIELSPTMAILYYNRGLIYREIGESEKAQSDFDKAGILDPKYKQ